jgi:hypothetical protein
MKIGNILYVQRWYCAFLTSLQHFLQFVIRPAMLTGTSADMERPISFRVQTKETYKYFSTLCNPVLHICQGIYLPNLIC